MRTDQPFKTEVAHNPTGFDCSHADQFVFANPRCYASTLPCSHSREIMGENGDENFERRCRLVIARSGHRPCLRDQFLCQGDVSRIGRCRLGQDRRLLRHQPLASRNRKMRAVRRWQDAHPDRSRAAAPSSKSSRSAMTPCTPIAIRSSRVRCRSPTTCRRSAWRKRAPAGTVTWSGKYDAKGASDADAKKTIDGVYQAGVDMLVK